MDLEQTIHAYWVFVKKVYDHIGTVLRQRLETRIDEIETKALGTSTEIIMRKIQITELWKQKVNKLEVELIDYCTSMCQEAKFYTWTKKVAKNFRNHIVATMDNMTIKMLTENSM